MHKRYRKVDPVLDAEAADGETIDQLKNDYCNALFDWATDSSPDSEIALQEAGDAYDNLESELTNYLED